MEVMGGKREAWRRPVEGSIMMKKASWQTRFSRLYFGTPAYFNSAAITQLELFSSIARHLISRLLRRKGKKNALMFL